MRTRNSFLNMITALIPYAIIGVLGFVKIRYCLRGLGSEANGLIQMVYRVLSYLSLAEMGFGSALIYKLYKPLNDKDTKKICILMNTANKFFIKVGIGVTLITLGITIIFPIFIHNSSFSNLTLCSVFILAAIPYIVEYIWYKKYYILICADQKQYVVNIIFNLLTIIYDIILILALVKGINIIVYILLCYPFTFLKGILLSLYCRKKYGFLKNKTDEIDKSARNLSNDVLVNRVGNLINDSSDQIVLSIFKGLTFVSIYTSYYYIVKYIKDIVTSILNSTVHSFGNLFTDNNIKSQQKYPIFKEYLSLAEVMAIIITVCFFIAILPFINVWINKSEYILNNAGVIAFSLLVFADIIIIPFSVIVTASGLFKETKLYAFIAAIVNLVLSMALIIKYEIFGIVIATVITKLLILTPLYINVIYKNTFEKMSKKYSYTHILESLLITTIIILVFKVIHIDNLYHHSLVNWILVSSLVFTITSFVVGAFYYITNSNFKNFTVRCIQLIKNKKFK